MSLLDERIERLETSGRGGLVYSADNVSNPPTDAELDTAFGVAADLFNGFQGLVNDNGADTLVWECSVAGGAWFYTLKTKAV